MANIEMTLLVVAAFAGLVLLALAAASVPVAAAATAVSVAHGRSTPRHWTPVRPQSAAACRRSTTPDRERPTDASDSRPAPLGSER